MDDEEAPIVPKLEKADPSEFPQRDRKPVEKFVEFPPSTDKEFWGDAQMVNRPKADIDRELEALMARINGHVPKMQGSEFVCKSCPFEHSLPIDSRKYTINRHGEIVVIDNKT